MKNKCGRTLWLTRTEQITQLERVAFPLLLQLAELKVPASLNVIVRLTVEEKRSIRTQYAAIFTVYQRCTYLASRIGAKFTALLDLKVFLEDRCNFELVLDNSPITFVLDESRKCPDLAPVNLIDAVYVPSNGPCFVPASPLLGMIPEEGVFEVVALGGTFDHLHSGHKLMLSLALLLTSTRMICGITDASMLEKKTHPELLESLQSRIDGVQSFLAEFEGKHRVRIEIVTLCEAYGPTIEDSGIGALIVSPETLAGGLKINSIRHRNNIPELDIVQVDFIIADDKEPEVKLSSTFIRDHLK